MRNPLFVVLGAALAITTLPARSATPAGELITIQGTVLATRAIEEPLGEGTTITTLGSVHVSASSAPELIGTVVPVRVPGGTVGQLHLAVSHVPVLEPGNVVHANAQRSSGGYELVSDRSPELEEEPEPHTAAYSTFGTSWECPTNLPIRLYHNLINAPAEAREAVNRGLSSWEDDPDSWIDFEDAGLTTTSAPANDARQSVTWHRIADAGVLARTWVWSTTARIVHVDIEFNTGYAWSTNPTQSEIDIESVALHEAGHALGLDHSADPAAMMYPTYAPGAIRRTLAGDDLAGVRSLYPNADLRAANTSLDPPNVPLPIVSGQVFPTSIARYTFAVQLRNDGRTPWGRWTHGDVPLRVVHVSAHRDGAAIAGDSPFCDTSWVDCSTPMVHAAPVVCRGGTVWLEFTMRGPAARGQYRQRFAVETLSGQRLGTTFEWSNLVVA